MNNIQEKIFQALDIYLEKRKITKKIEDFPTVIKAIDNDKAIVSIDGAEYKAKNGLGMKLKIGMPVWVHAMQGNMNQLYIISIRNMAFDDRTGGIQWSEGTAVESDVLVGKTFSNNTGINKVGTMPNRGSINQTLSPSNTSYNISQGYHNGNGVISILPQEKTITSSYSIQTIVPDDNKILSKVTVNPLTQNGTFTPTTNSSAHDMGASNTYRYVNTNIVYDLGIQNCPVNILFNTFQQVGYDLGVTWNYTYSASKNGKLVAFFCATSQIEGVSSRVIIFAKKNDVNQNLNYNFNDSWQVNCYTLFNVNTNDYVQFYIENPNSGRLDSAGLFVCFIG